MSDEFIPWKQPAFKIACKFMHDLVDNPLSQIYKRKGVNVLVQINNQLEKSEFTTVASWKEALYRVFNEETNLDDDERRINFVLKKKFEKTFNYIMKIELSKFRDIMDEVNQDIKIISQNLKSENYSFQKLHE